MTVYAAPNTEGSVVSFKPQYENSERSNVLNRIADRIEDNLEMLAVAETWDNGKAVRETLAADLPWPSTTSATSPAPSAPRRAASPSSTRTPSPTTSRSRWASSARSSRGTSRC
jgi:hypothetical protein